ncbi:hypothetical protein [Kaistia nematophila]|uniref:Uncharacterized protein n=1 Tax=Kaistia nematophila TaxID=2994654 RepID=A0A9X3E2P2_9HYPH|nr:hypothetical protein [Kaistia nematophila]MCX5570626.1 hypothetical protein [Kaistia nematophila]
MPITRGYIGLREGQFVFQFSRPGYDVLTAPASGLVFDSTAKRLRPLLSGITAALPTGNTNIPLPKTFTGLPLILVDMFYGASGVRGPGRGFEVTYRRASNYFTINNTTAGAVFSYNVFDNEMT